jgi:outer membrane protein assembly factor BamA
LETVEREIRAQAGQACDAACIQADLDRLERLGAFAGLSGVRVSDTLVFRLIELPLVVPVPNGRISDEEGISLGAGLKAPNLFGKAVAGEFLFLLGHSTEWQLNMGAPRLGDAALGWELFTSRTDRWDEGRAYKEVSYTSRAGGQFPTDSRLRGLADLQVTQFRSDRTGIALSVDREDVIPMVRLGALWDGRDRISLTTSGLYQELSIKKSGEPLNGPVDSWEYLADTRAWIPFGARWGIHASHLIQVQTGRTGGWQTFVLGGANTVRGLKGNWANAPSEEIGSLEMRWTAVPSRTVKVWDANLFYGVQVVAGVDVGVAWDRNWGERKGLGIFSGVDIVIPFLERVRLVFSESPQDGNWHAGFAVGLFEKTVIERYRVR